ncbi:enoyl-CoA hydratase [Thermaurantimonas aggregans]|uniref:Enoyl-CoA hydratase n=1 Tax=Thermaurantimonas aggregans TaxID=2173829 RepID=A0A401XKB0_9FLAO|nr:enoyl-CoA hydratase/isomerase family protein [Thermaurantimonas aggregans]MCX8148342.1 enoyl-CoA hydratase/isomerase family protein [Thermaurantimonas aggregans]GCD77466.1 enoyl-CoA hydratase [Thermaurantimonas aggregans]
MQPYVRTSIKERIAEVEFFHPAGNSLPSSMLRELADAFKRLSNTDEVSVIVLRSGGDKAFCGGASFDELIQIEDLEQGKAFFSGFANVINAMRKAPQVIIGRIHGKAVGGGIGLACSCDYTFGTTHSHIKLSELAVGIGPFVVGPAIERKAGKAAFSEMALEPAVWKSAEWAHQKGIYQYLAKDQTELDEKTMALAMQLTEYNPQALYELKKIFWQNTDDWDVLLPQRAEISGKLVLSDFTKSFIKKFKNK